MKKISLPILVLGLLSLLSGWLLSKASLVGRVGIRFFYQEYRFLKIWWQGSLVVFTILILLFLLQGQGLRRLGGKGGALLQIFMMLVCLAGTWLTYEDFQHSITHHLLGQRFHLGIYLFWIGWLLICIFYLFQSHFYETKRGHTPVQKEEQSS